MFDVHADRTKRQAVAGGGPVSSGTTGTVVGVQLAEGSIHLARRVDGRIDAVQSVAVPPGVALASPEYARIVTRVLQEFCGHCGRVGVWATATFPGMSQRNLTIPIVPGRQLPMAVRWALRRELSSSLKGMLVDYTIEGECIGQGGKRTSVVACAVRESDVVRIAQMFAEAGYPLTGLTIPGCSLGHLVEHSGLLDTQHAALFLHIGADASHILLWSRKRILANREFRLGVSAFTEAALGKSPSEAVVERFLRQLSAPDGVMDSATGESRAAVMDAFRPVLLRLMRQFDLTLEASTVNSSDLDLRCLHLSGPLAGCPDVRAFIGAHVGLPVEVLNPLAPPFVSGRGVLREGDAPDGCFITPCGLTFADGERGLNLLHPSQSTVEREERQNLNHIIFMVFLALALGCAGFWTLASAKARRLEKRYDALRQRMAATEMLLVEERLDQQLQKVLALNGARIRSIQKQLPLALVSELVRRTPESIEWLSLDVEMASFARQTGVAPPQGTGSKVPGLSMTGLVHGDPTRQASDLAAYQVLLSESVLLKDVSVERSTPRVVDERPVLSFRMVMTPVLPGTQGEEAQ